MLVASPITRQTTGRTFIVAISLLGAIAAVQCALLVWAFATRPRVPQRIAIVDAGLAAAEKEDADFGADPIKSVEPAAPPVAPPKPAETPVAPEQVAALTPPKPTPLPARSPALAEPEESARFKEMIDFGKRERERGDTNAALNRFREAERMSPKSPEAIYEMAITFEKMSLQDKAAEQWRRMYEMGESAGPYFTAAEARLNQAKQATMTQAAPAATAAAAETEEGIASGKSLGLLEVVTEEQDDRNAAKHLVLRIPIKARAREKVDVRDLTIQVLFYDTVDNTNLVQTTANVSSRWTSSPADWQDSNVETLEVDYQLPLPEAKAAKRETRKYFGYLIRIYYKGELQAATGAPERLEQQFPPEQKLPADSQKN